MKLVEMRCQSCGAPMEIEDGQKEVVCECCGAKYILDDEVQHVKHDNMMEAGYEFEKGRQKAQAEARYNNYRAAPQYQPAPQPQTIYVKQKKSYLWAWILGWIFIFPIPFTILMVRTKRWGFWVRFSLVIAAWIIYIALMVIAYANGGSK